MANTCQKAEKCRKCKGCESIHKSNCLSFYSLREEMATFRVISNGLFRGVTFLHEGNSFCEWLIEEQSEIMVTFFFTLGDRLTIRIWSPEK